MQRINHLGTLGTWNHFIEVCLDENRERWFLVHSESYGWDQLSRGTGDGLVLCGFDISSGQRWRRERDSNPRYP